MRRIRSLLCVPAHKPELYEKAARSGADCLMFDLEDSVPEQHKASALLALTSWLASDGWRIPGMKAVRINPYTHDALVLRDNGCRVDALVIPKIKHGDELLTPDGIAPTTPLIPVIETPQAIINLRSIVENRAVAGAIFGVADFAAGMGVSDRLCGHGIDDYLEEVNERFAYAKQKLATYCAAFGKFALDTCFAVKGERAAEVVEQSWRNSRSWGFTGAAAIHPAQVKVANLVFRDAREACWAASVIDSDREHAGEVHVDERGFVVGRPVVRQAEAIFDRVGKERA